jgi:hypothetical protein
MIQQLEIKYHLLSMEANSSKVNSAGKDNVCNCNKPEFYNVVISGKYIGWTEIHCNNCGKLVAYIDSSKILTILK